MSVLSARSSSGMPSSHAVAIVRMQFAPQYPCNQIASNFSCLHARYSPTIDRRPEGSVVRLADNGKKFVTKALQ